MKHIQSGPCETVSDLFSELTKDNQAIHGERLRLWRDFNYCWLAYLTRQLDDSRRILARGQSLAPGQRVLSKAALQNLGDELTKLCDGLEKAGLVDYEMGVWEEEIINCLFSCPGWPLSTS